MFEFMSHVSIGGFVWISSLDTRDKGVTRRILEDLLALLERRKVPATLAEPSTSAEFWSVFDWLEVVAKSGLRPIVHFDMHGSRQRGMLIAQSHEYVSWRSISERLRQLNSLTENNLCVVTSVCFGYNVIDRLSIDDVCPFYLLIAPIEEISAGVLADNMYEFYKVVFEDMSIVQAYEKHLRPHMEFFHCEKALLIIFIRYILQFCVGRAGHARREALLSEIIIRGLVNNKANRRYARDQIKRMVRPTQKLLDKTARIFLMRDDIGFQLKDIQKIASNVQKPCSAISHRLPSWSNISILN